MVLDMVTILKPLVINLIGGYQRLRTTPSQIERCGRGRVTSSENSVERKVPELIWAVQ